jgi:hypothetical protein
MSLYDRDYMKTPPPQGSGWAAWLLFLLVIILAAAAISKSGLYRKWQALRPARILNATR